MSSFSHLSASHNSNNGNPKKHRRAPAWCDSAIWLGSRAPVCRDHAPAHPPPAGTARKLVLRQGTKSWPARPVVETSVLGLRKSPSVHCSKPTAPLAHGWCRRKHHVFSAFAVPKSFYTGQPSSEVRRWTKRSRSDE